MRLFRRKLEPDAAGFYPTDVAATAVAENEITPVHINDVRIILTRVEGELHAFNSRCPHAAADLAKGTLYKGRIDCPDHGYRFDVGNGRVLWPADELCRLKKYPVKVKDGQVEVRLD